MGLPAMKENENPLPPSPAPPPARPIHRHLHNPSLRQLHRLGQLGKRIDLVRHRHGMHEQLLEMRLQRGFDFLDLGPRRLDLAAVFAVLGSVATSAKNIA